MKNIEINSPLLYKDIILEKLKEINAIDTWAREQVDIFYDVYGKDSWLKVRFEDNIYTLISYKRSSDILGPRESEYFKIENIDKSISQLLSHVLRSTVIVNKIRNYWHYKHTKIHLDTVDGLGNFIELETLTNEISLEEATQESNEVIILLGLDPTKFISVPYAELLISKK